MDIICLVPFRHNVKYKTWINGYSKGKKGKGNPYSIAERRVLEPIPVFGSQPAGDVINPAVGCHYFPPGPQSPSQSVGRYQFCCLVNRGTMDVNSLPKTVTRQRRGCDLNPGHTAPESSTVTTRLPSHPALLDTYNEVPVLSMDDITFAYNFQS